MESRKKESERMKSYENEKKDGKSWLEMSLNGEGSVPTTCRILGWVGGWRCGNAFHDDGLE